MNLCPELLISPTNPFRRHLKLTPLFFLEDQLLLHTLEHRTRYTRFFVVLICPR